jgi:hypothetical protein
MIKILCLISCLFVGDDNNARGVARSLAQQYGEGVQSEEYNRAHEDAYTKTIDEALAQEKRIVVIGAGESCLEPLKKLKQKYGNKLFAAWAGHQIPTANALCDLKLFDQVAVPIASISPSDKDTLKDILIETIGVPHNLTLADIEQEHQEWKSRLPMPEGPRMVVVLGGDAPDAQGRQLLYTGQEAQALAHYLIARAREKNAFIYVTNGPRTGKYNESTRTEEAGAHRGEAPLSEPTEAVSKAFIKAIADQGWERVHFADFRYGQKSSFKALLKIADELYLPGESTSMISEAADFVSQLIVYHTHSMNENHYASLEHIKTLYPLAVLTKTFNYQQPSSMAQKAMPAAQQVAQGIIEKMKKKE